LRRFNFRPTSLSTSTTTQTQTSSNIHFQSIETSRWRHYIRRNDTRHEGTQYNGRVSQCSHFAACFMPIVVILSVFMFVVIMLCIAVLIIVMLGVVILIFLMRSITIWPVCCLLLYWLSNALCRNLDRMMTIVMLTIKCFVSQFRQYVVYCYADYQMLRVAT
jgi:Flp pilus assembly protein TadB